MIRTIFIILTLVHGLIHFMGFSKAFGYGQLTQLTNEISKPVGVFWFAAAILFIFTLIFYLFKKDFWPYLAIISIVLSQLLIFNNWQDARFGTIANVIILLVAILGIFQIRFQNQFGNEVKIGLDQGRNLQKSILNDYDLKNLPEPVKKYIRYTSSVGKPKIINFKAEFSGKIRDHAKPVWMPLTSQQYNFINTSTRLFFS